MGLDLVVHKGAQPMMALTPAMVNYDLLQKYVEKQEAGAERTFPGERIAFKKGFWIRPDKLDKKQKPEKFDLDMELVANAPNIVFYWRKWVDKRPTYHSIAYPALGQDLPGRDELGDHDKSLWEQQKDEDTGVMKAVDPWQRGACVVLRDRETGEIFHFDSTSMGGRQFMMALLKAFAADGRTKPGQLPVIKLDTEEKDHWEKKNVTFYVPMFDVIDWTKATEADNPKKGGISVTEEDREEVEVKGVKATKRGDAASNARAAVEEEKPTTRVKSKKVEDVDDEEEEEKPRRRRTVNVDED